jgi:flagellar secretion chaperone FliS
MSRAAALYKTVDLESAPKHRIVERLFERFARDVEQARAALATKDIKGKAVAIDHALRIVSELEASLDHAAAPELCANLAGLYGFVSRRLVDANTTLAVAGLDDAARIMRNLDEAFRQAHPQ